MFINDSQIEEIKSRIDIVDIISPVVPCKGPGKSLKGLCPFHQEKTPSFFVNRIKQNFHCFGCGVSGDIFTFIMKFEGLNFIDTVKKLAQQAGVTLQEENPNDPVKQKKDNLYQINNLATSWFSANFNDKNIGKQAREYILKRGISENIIQAFSLGFAPDSWSGLYTYLNEKGFSDNLILESGLCIMSEKKQNMYDRFRGRLMFPIYNSSSSIVGFSARLLNNSDDKAAKYVNSPETLIFKKNHLLYGMHNAKTAISKLDFAILSEGHIDVLALHTHGYTQSLGVQGTAFTMEHAKWITRHTKNLYIIFDGDSAGIKAALRILPIGLAAELNCKICILPEKHDPASLLKEKGREIIQSYLDKSESLFEFKIKQMMQGKELSPDKKVTISSEIIEDLKSVKNPVLKDSLMQILASYLKVSPQSIEAEFNRTKKRSNYYEKLKINSSKSSLSTPSHLNAFSPSEKELIRIILSSSKAHGFIFENLDFKWLIHKECLEIVDRCFNLHCEKHFSSDNLINIFKDRADYLEIINWAKDFKGYKNKIFQAAEETIKKLEDEFIKRRINLLTSKLNRSEIYDDKSQKDDIMKEIDYLRKNRFLNKNSI